MIITISWRSSQGGGGGGVRDSDFGFKKGHFSVSLKFHFSVFGFKKGHFSVFSETYPHHNIMAIRAKSEPQYSYKGSFDNYVTQKIAI